MKITIATIITCVRILLTPFVVYSLLIGQWLQALVLFLTAALTDVVDGYVARNWKQESSFGQMLDPVADKTLLLGSMGALVYQVSNVYVQYALQFLILKELVLLVGAFFLYKKYNVFIKPSFLSRLASLAEFILIVFIVLQGQFHIFPLWMLHGLLILFCMSSGALLLRYGLYVLGLLRGKR